MTRVIKNSIIVTNITKTEVVIIVVYIFFTSNFYYLCHYYYIQYSYNDSYS